MSNQPAPTTRRHNSHRQPRHPPKTCENVQTRQKTTFSNSRKSMLNTDPRGSPKQPRKASRVRNIVIYDLNARLIERRDRLARYGVGLLNLHKRVRKSDGP